MAKKTPDMDIAAAMREKGVGGPRGSMTRPGFSVPDPTKAPQIIRTSTMFRPTPMKKGR